MPVALGWKGVRRCKALLWLAAVVLLALHFALSLQQNGKPFLDADAYSHYQAKLPYQYRSLMAPVLGGLVRAFAQPPAQALLAKLPVYLATPEAMAYLAINAVAFALSCLLVHAIAAHALGRTTTAALAVLLYIGTAYLFFCLNPNIAFILPYDLPSLALSQACILCVLKGRWRWLPWLFVLATFNRETSFLVIVFAAVRAVLEGTVRVSLARIGLLCLLWLAVKAGLYLAFAGLPSDEGLRVVQNLRSVLNPLQWPALLPLLASVAATLWSLRSLRSLRASQTQHEWALTGLLGFAMIATVGQLTETRAFADLMVFFALAIAQWLAARGSDGRGSGRVSGRPQPGG